jgi:protein-tyrosine phosphatase
MEDNYNILLSANATTAITTAGQIIKWYKAGWKILVTCYAGLNRSSFAVAIALIIGPWKMSFDEAVAVIRSARGEYALNNPQFLRYLKTYYSKLSARSK